MQIFFDHENLFIILTNVYPEKFKIGISQARIFGIPKMLIGKYSWTHILHPYASGFFFCTMSLRKYELFFPETMSQSIFYINVMIAKRELFHMLHIYSFFFSIHKSRIFFEHCSDHQFRRDHLSETLKVDVSYFGNDIKSE